MSVRQSTIVRYATAAKNLEAALIDNSGYIESNAFALANTVSAGTIGDLLKHGFIVRIGKRRYERTSKPITHGAMKRMLEQREADRARAEKAKHDRTAANDPVQQSMKLVQPVGGPEKAHEIPLKKSEPSVSLEQYRALERRVASLEQLLIRRGVA